MGGLWLAAPRHGRHRPCSSPWPRSACPALGNFVAEFLILRRHLAGQPAGRRARRRRPGVRHRLRAVDDAARLPGSRRRTAWSLPDLTVREVGMLGRHDRSAALARLLPAAAVQHRAAQPAPPCSSAPCAHARARRGRRQRGAARRRRGGAGRRRRRTGCRRRAPSPTARGAPHVTGRPTLVTLLPLIALTLSAVIVMLAGTFHSRSPADASVSRWPAWRWTVGHAVRHRDPAARARSPPCCCSTTTRSSSSACWR